MKSAHTWPKRLFWVGGCVVFWTLLQATSAQTLSLHTRSRVASQTDTNDWRIVEKTVAWDAAKTAVVICDMWDKHHCPDATERVGEMAPRMNDMIKVARAKGALIIHCPSDTMDFYKDHPGRKLAQGAPKVETAIPLERWCSLKPDKEALLPIDDSDGGCDGCPDCPTFKAWTRQHPALEIMPGDAITDSAEAYYLMRQRGITNVIVMGVHINMCVLGRPFSIRQMVRQGQNVLLVRDLTDSMYNHRKSPYVSHFRGTELVAEHIEKFWCASIASSDFIGGEPFRFKGDVKKEVCFIIGENEYRTWETLPEFAKKELAWRGYKLSFVTASQKVDDYDFKNWEAIPRADVLVVSARRRAPPKGMMDAIRAHVAAGKPVVGIRTASHAFELSNQKEPSDTTWLRFDDEVLGADYQNHYGAGPETIIRQITETAGNPILNGVKAEFRSKSSLYRNRNLVNTVTPLLNGRTDDGKSAVEPVAWINTREHRRVFYTSLGSPEDFANPDFRRLLLNGILWALDEFIPPAEAKDKSRTSVSPAQPEVNAATQKGARRTDALPLPAGEGRGEGERAGLDGAPNATQVQPEAGATPALRSLQLTPLSPEVSAKSFHVFDDLVFEQVLAEPIIEQPVFLTFDERGRMWVVQYRQYPDPAGLKMVSRDNFWRAVYDRIPPPPPNHFKGADKITIHEDTDGDGKFDKHKTFLDGLNIVTSVALGRGGLFVLNPPYLLFYADKDRDDVPDGDPQVLLSGFGLEDTHSVANSLRWGPDGWLYACQGSTVTGNILVYGANKKALNDKPIFSQGQNIWRYHPEKRVYEIFSEGGGNAFGLEIDSAGRIFSGHNGGNTRGFHYMQGAYLQKGFDKHGPLSNPNAFGYFPPMAHSNVDRFTHNFLIYDSGALGERYQGKLFGVEPLQGRIVMSEITADGSTFRTRDLGHPVTSDDKWFRPVDIKLGPDGAIYVADWYDRQVNHYRNHEGQMDAGNGRIYRLKAKAGSDGKLTGNGAYPNERLVDEAQGTHRWYQQTALRLIADRGDKSKADSLRAALREQARDPGRNASPTDTAMLGARQRQKALGSLWALNASGELSPADAAFCLGHWAPEVRLWTIRLLGDEKYVSPAIVQQLAALASVEPSLEVRAQLACTAKRLPAANALPIVRNLLAHEADASDARQPLLLWWAIEAHCAEFGVPPSGGSPRPPEGGTPNGRDAIVALFSNRDLWRAPIVQQHILARLMRRFASTGQREDLLTCAKLFALSPGPEQTAQLTRGFEEAYKGRPMIGLPEELLAAMEKAGGESILIGARRGKPAVVEQALAIIADDSADAAKRFQLIHVFGETPQPKAVPVLLSLAHDAKKPELRKAALGALQIYGSADIATEVLSQLPSYPTEVRAAALSLLTSREQWALALLQAVDAGRIDKAVVPNDSVRRLHSVGADVRRSADSLVRESVTAAEERADKAVRAPMREEMKRLLAKHWPNIRQATSAELEKEITRLNEVINLAVGSPYSGKKLFMESCGVCHKLFSKGGEAGPDLTVYKRDDLANLLLNIVNPNAEIREGYESFNVETKDGRELTGFLADKDAQVIILRTPDGQSVSLPHAQISSMAPAGSSLMPQGLLTNLSDQQVRDLFAYLRSTQPLNDGN